MAEFSEENGKHKGLNWIPGKVMKIPSSKKFMVPHVGWNDLNNTNDSILFNNKIKKKNFYFDHSYHYLTSEENVIAKTHYNVSIVAAIKKGNIIGVQFHPEKSSSAGLSLFKNFLKIVDTC